MESKKRTLQTMSPLKIGNVEMQNPLVLAPMAGVTDLPFRVLCKEQGAGLICMEMVSAKAILYKNKNTEDLMTIHPGEHPVSLQLFGSDPEILAQIAAQIEERPFDILDFNMGCPVPKVVNNGEVASGEGVDNQGNSLLVVVSLDILFDFFALCLDFEAGVAAHTDAFDKALGHNVAVVHVNELELQGRTPTVHN